MQVSADKSIDEEDKLVNWVSEDLRGLNLKKQFRVPKRPWSTSLTAQRERASDYVKQADRPVSRNWNFRVHLDLAELDAAIQYHNDWALAGLRPSSNAEWLEPSNNEDFTHGGQVPSRNHYGEFNGDDHQIIGSLSTAEVTGELGAARAYEDHVALSAADLRDMATPKTDEESVVNRLVVEYINDGGTIKLCPPGMTTRRDSARRVVEWVLPSGTPIRSAAVCDQAHAMPLNWFQARHRRIHRRARKALRTDEAALVEAVVLHGEPMDAIPVLKAALQRLAKYYATFVPAETFAAWKDRVSSNFEHALGAAE